MNFGFAQLIGGIRININEQCEIRLKRDKAYVFSFFDTKIMNIIMFYYRFKFSNYVSSGPSH